MEEYFSLSSVKQVSCPSPDQFSIWAKGVTGKNNSLLKGRSLPFWRNQSKTGQKFLKFAPLGRLTKFHLPALGWRFCYATCLVALCWAVVICLYHSNRDTVFLQGTALWPTVTPLTSMPPPVQSAFNRPTLQLYLTFRTRRAPKALCIILEREGQSTNCRFSNHKLTLSDLFTFKSCEFFL